MSFTAEEETFIEQQQKEIEAYKTSTQSGQVQQAQQAMMYQEQEKSMIKDQLDLIDELDTIDHLLRGQFLKDSVDTNGRVWADPSDPNSIILTEHGVQLIMNTIMFYLNKNTLLSNYDEDMINHKMEDFATDLADTIFMEYEKVFQYPTQQECFTVLKDRIDKKTELRMFALELVGQVGDAIAIRESFVEEIEDKIENEIAKIKEQVIKNKIKRFLIIIREIQDAVHSTYLRAYKGQERKTLRQHIHISENVGMNQPPKNPRKLNLLNYG